MPDTIKVPPLVTRSASFTPLQKQEGDDGPDRYEMTATTEAPVRRGWFNPYDEVLALGKASDVDMTRFDADAVPFLRNHSSYDVLATIGIVHEMRVEDRKLKAVVSFDEGDETNKEIKRRVDAKMLRNVSIGYDLQNAEYEEKGSGDDGSVPTRTFYNWMPTEISMVAVGADPNAGVGRARNGDAETEFINVRQRESTRMPPSNDAGDGATEDTKGTSAAPQVVRQPDDTAVLRKAMADLDSWANTPELEKYNPHSIAAEIRDSEADPSKWVKAFTDKIAEKRTANVTANSETTVVDERQLEFGQRNTLGTAASDIGMEAKDIGRFSLSRALNLVIASDSRSGMAIPKDAGFENEIMTAARERKESMRMEPHGAFTLPPEIYRSLFSNRYAAQRDLTVGAGTGGRLVGTDHRADLFIDALRDEMAVMDRVTILDGLEGNVDIPKQTGVSTLTFLSDETSPVTQTVRDSAGTGTEDVHAEQPLTPSEPTFGTVQLRLKEAHILARVSRRLLIQSSPAIDSLLESSLRMDAQLGMERSMLLDDGTAGKPTGLNSQTDVNDEGTVGALTWKGTVDFETAVAEANALFPGAAYLAGAGVIGLMKTTSKDAGSGRFIMEDGQVNGYPMLRTNAIAAGNMFFGSWPQILVGLWSGIDLVTDPVTLMEFRLTRLLLFIDMDVGIRNGESFAKGTGITAPSM